MTTAGDEFEAMFKFSDEIPPTVAAPVAPTPEKPAAPSPPAAPAAAPAAPAAPPPGTMTEVPVGPPWDDARGGDGGNRGEGETDDDGPCVVFDVGAPRSGNELRPITYFPITSTFRKKPPTSVIEAHVISPYHMSFDTSVGRMAKWTSKNTVVAIERRYSELVALRNLLAIQFPYLLIPPLLPKTTSDHAATILQQEGERHAQRRRLKRFLNDLSQLPVVLFGTDVVQKFFQSPREQLLSGVMTRIRDLTIMLGDAHSSITDRRKLSPDAGALATIAAASTSVLRSVVAWVQGSDSSPAPTAALEEKISASLKRTPGYTQWEPLIERFSNLREPLREAAKGYTAVLQAETAMLDDLAAVTPACTDVGAVIAGCNYLTGVRMLLVEEGSFVSTIAAKRRQDVDQRYVRVVEWLQREEEWASIAIDVMEFVRCVHIRMAETNLTQSPTPSPVNRQALETYCTRITLAAKEAMETFQLEHNKRLSRVVLKMRESCIEGLAAEQEACADHVMVRRIREKDYNLMYQLPELAS